MKYESSCKEDFMKLVQHEILTTAEAIELLGVTRQTLNSLVKRGKIIPIKEVSRDKLFLREDIENRKKQSKSLQDKYRPYDN